MKVGIDITIVVIASRHRKPFITGWLRNVSYALHVTTDYDLPAEFRPLPQYESLVLNQKGAYRCFMGHQDALRDLKTEVALVLEDDAVPSCGDWLEQCLDVAGAFQDSDIISLHARAFDEAEFVHKGYYTRTILLPKNNGFFALGSLAYIITKRLVPIVTATKYDGLPWDLFLYRTFSPCILHPSPFIHDRSRGTLIE